MFGIEFFTLKLIGLLLYGAAAFMVGKNFYRLNSIDDLAAAFVKARSHAEALKVKAEEAAAAARSKVEAQIKEAEEKIAKAKELL